MPSAISTTTSNMYHVVPSRRELGDEAASMYSLRPKCCYACIRVGQTILSLGGFVENITNIYIFK